MNHGKKPKKPFNPMTMEKTMSDIQKTLAEKNFSSLDEANAFLKTMVGKEPLEHEPVTPLDKAQDMIYDAWDEENPKEKKKIAKEAISVCEDCADAYLILAELENNDKKALSLYEKAVEAGQRSLGEDFFKENQGHFWGMIESRPYMRAKAALAECLWMLERDEEALSHYRELLQLNPNDNQGIRYVLSSCLLNSERYDELWKFISSQYADDCGTEWLYTKALVLFKREGPSQTANRVLAEALNANRHVPMAMLEFAKDETIATDFESVTFGGPDEALSYVSHNAPAWFKDQAAMKWLIQSVKAFTSTLGKKSGRNDLCPCGSGKKFKKCCIVYET